MARVGNFRLRARANEGDICPRCNTGTMIEKRGSYGRFLGCSCYPECRNTVNISSTSDNDVPREPRLADRVQELEELVANLTERIETLEYYLDEEPQETAA